MQICGESATMPIDEGSCGEMKARVSRAIGGVARVADTTGKANAQCAKCVVRGGWNGHGDETGRGRRASVWTLAMVLTAMVHVPR